MMTSAEGTVRNLRFQSFAKMTARGPERQLADR
jgi:hypothetical protein